MGPGKVAPFFQDLGLQHLRTLKNSFDFTFPGPSAQTLAINIKGNMDTKIKFFERILGFTIILTALSKYQLLISLKNMQGMFSIFVVSIFFISALLGFIGLFRGRLWGYISIYIFVPVATYGMGISVFPFIIKLIPYTYRTTAIIVVGILFLLTTISIHISKRVALKVGSGHANREGVTF